MKYAAIILGFALVSSPVRAEPTVGCPSFSPSAAAMTLEAAADELEGHAPENHEQQQNMRSNSYARLLRYYAICMRSGDLPSWRVRPNRE
jgi:hypothetical protein